jgi:hypothetical protein
MQEDFSGASQPSFHIPRDYLDAYPTLEKALLEQRIYQHLLPPYVYKQLQPRMIDIISQTIEAPPAEKEGLMVAAILMTGGMPPSPEIIQATFGTETAKVIANVNKTVNGGEMTRDFARIMTLEQIFEMENFTAQLRDGDAPLRANYVRDVKKQRMTPAEMAEQMLLPCVDAPLLENLYRRVHHALRGETGLLHGAPPLEKVQLQ